MAAEGMIPAQAGQDDPASAAAPAPQPGSAGPGGSPAPDQGPGDPVATDPAAMIPADAQGQQVDGADAAGPRAKGTQQDAYDAAVDADPNNAEVPATPEEQAQYHSLVSRFILFISDPRQSTPKHASPSQSVLSMLNAPTVPAAIALGRATAHVVMTLMQSAKMQGKPYDAEVVFHAGDELIPAMYLLGAAHGIWKGLPPYHGIDADGSYDFQDDEIKVIGEAKMQGTRFLGDLMVKAGWITPDIAQQNAALWKEQIQREVESGSVSDEVMEMLAKRGTFDKIHDQLGTTGLTGAAGPAGSSGSSDPEPTAPPAAAPSPAPTPAPDAAGAPAQPGQPGMVPTDGGQP